MMLTLVTVLFIDLIMQDSASRLITLPSDQQLTTLSFYVVTGHFFASDGKSVQYVAMKGQHSISSTD